MTYILGAMQKLAGETNSVYREMLDWEARLLEDEQKVNSAYSTSMINAGTFIYEPVCGNLLNDVDP